MSTKSGVGLSESLLLVHEQVEQSRRDERSLQGLLQTLIHKLNETSVGRQEKTNSENKTKKTLKHISARLNIAESANKRIEVQVQDFRAQVSGSLLSEIAQQRDCIDRESRQLYEDLQQDLQANNEQHQDLQHNTQLTKPQKQLVKKAEQLLNVQKKQQRNVQTKWLKMIQDSMRIKSRSGVLEDQLVEMITRDLNQQRMHIIQENGDGGKVQQIKQRLELLQRKQQVRDVDHSNRMREMRSRVSLIKYDVSKIRKQSNSLSYGVRSVVTEKSQNYSATPQNFSEQQMGIIADQQFNGKSISVGNVPAQYQQSPLSQSPISYLQNKQIRSRSVNSHRQQNNRATPQIKQQITTPHPPQSQTPIDQPLKRNRKSPQTASSSQQQLQQQLQRIQQQCQQKISPNFGSQIVSQNNENDEQQFSSNLSRQAHQISSKNEQVYSNSPQMVFNEHSTNILYSGEQIQSTINNNNVLQQQYSLQSNPNSHTNSNFMQQQQQQRSSFSHRNSANYGATYTPQQPQISENNSSYVQQQQQQQQLSGTYAQQQQQQLSGTYAQQQQQQLSGTYAQSTLRTSGVTSSIPTIPTPPRSSKKNALSSRTQSQSYISRAQSRPHSRVSNTNSNESGQSTTRMSVFSRDSFWENMVKSSSPIQARSYDYTDPKKRKNKEELVKQLHRVKSLLNYDMQIKQES